MDDTKFTGAFTFPDPANPDGRQFGLVGGTVAPSADRSVAIMLRTEGTLIRCETVDAGIRIDLPADLLRAMLPVLTRCMAALDTL
jgi:hypothetical protein